MISALGIDRLSPGKGEDICLGIFLCIFSFYIPSLLSGNGADPFGSWLLGNAMFITSILTIHKGFRDIAMEEKRVRSRPRLYE